MWWIFGRGYFPTSLGGGYVSLDPRTSTSNCNLNKKSCLRLHIITQHHDVTYIRCTALRLFAYQLGHTFLSLTTFSCRAWSWSKYGLHLVSQVTLP
jgi:hypothetical protein